MPVMNCSLDVLLSSPAAVERRTRRWLFEKRVVASGGERYVLYRFPTEAQAAALERFLVAGAEAGVPMQRFLGRTRGWRAAVRQRGYWLVSSYEPGEPLIGRGSAQTLSALGRALAALHSLESERPGPLFGIGLPWPGYAARLRWELSSVLRRGRAVIAAADCAAWLSEHGGFVEGIDRFQLAHGDLYGKNVLVRERGGAVYLIDYELAAYQPAGLELAVALLRAFCGEDAALRRSLLEAYLAHCTPWVREAWDEHHAFFLIAAALRLAGSRQRRARILARRGLPADQPRDHAVRYLQWAERMVRAHRAGARGAEALLECCVS